MTSTFLLAAGGTGGHLFPAEALAAELQRRGHAVELATDERAGAYGRAFPARQVHVIASTTLKSRNPVEIARAGLVLARGFAQSWRLTGRMRPAAAIGFGGYPTFPPLLAAQRRGLPTVLHEQNAVLGRANRVLAPRVTAIATSFAETGLLGPHAAKAVMTGNPVRDAVKVAASRPFDAPAPDGSFRLLVFGGSQGARFFADLVAPALERLRPDLRARLDLVQQCRPEDLDRVRDGLARLGLTAELAPFFADLPERMARSHLVLCRSGASTVAELSVIGRPSILVPLPHSLDQDQAANARALASAGAAAIVPQAELSPERLARELEDRMMRPDALSSAASAAKAQGRADAASRLADLVEHVAARGTPETFRTTSP